MYSTYRNVYIAAKAYGKVMQCNGKHTFYAPCTLGSITKVLTWLFLIPLCGSVTRIAFVNQKLSYTKDSKKGYHFIGVSIRSIGVVDQESKRIRFNGTIIPNVK